MKCLVTVTELGAGMWRHESECGRTFDLPTDDPITMTCRHGLCYDESAHAFPIKVGTAVARALHKLGASQWAGCGCARLIAKMNAWGPAGCREHKSEIVDHLFKQSKAKSTELPFGLDLRDLLGELVDEACRLAEATAQIAPGREQSTGDGH